MEAGRRGRRRCDDQPHGQRSCARRARGVARRSRAPDAKPCPRRRAWGAGPAHACEPHRLWSARSSASSPVASEDAWQENRTLVIERFSELVSIASPMGVRVALEPHFATVVCNAPRALDVLQTVDSQALGLNLDVSHFAVQGLPIGEAVRALGPHAIACEVKDQRGVAPDFQFLIPGEGDFDYAAFLTELAGVGYDGSVAVEISVFRQRVAGYDPYDAAARSHAVLAKAFEEAKIARPKRAARKVDT